jgi:integrase
MPRRKGNFAKYKKQKYIPTKREYNPKIDKRWIVYYPHPHRLNKIKSESFTGFPEAVERCNELNARHKQNKQTLKTEDWTISDALAFWVDKKASKLAGATKEVPRTEYIAVVIGDVRLADLTEEHYEKLSEYIKQDNTRRITTVRGLDAYFVTLRTALNYCKTKSKVVHFPALNDFIENDYDPRDRVATQDELKALYDACYVVKGGRDRKHLATIITWLHETACRSGELKTIRIKDIDIDAGLVKIRQSKRKNGTKVKYRNCGISPRLQAMILESNLLDYPDDALVIAQPIGFKTAIDFKKSFATACRIAKVDDLHIHDLRTTGITNMLERELPLPLVASMVGHEAESVMTLKVYTRFRQKFIAQEMRKLA